MEIITITKQDLVEIIENCLNKQLDFLKVEKPTELLTRKETAKILKCSLVSLNEWTKEGIIPAHRISTRIRYKYSEVIECLNKVDKI